MEPEVIERKENMVPKLRFEEFKDKWREVRLGKICSTFKSGSTITAKTIFEEGSYPVYGGNGLRGYTNTFTHDGFYFLIGRQGALCGNINKIEGKNFISEHAIAVQTDKENDTGWLAQKLEYFNLNRLSESSAQPGLAVSKLERLKLKIPPLTEQKKIATFLFAIDKKIQQLKHKKVLLDIYKKGLLQKLFSQEIRFKDDNRQNFSEWKNRKLRDILLEHKRKSSGGEKVFSVSVHKGLINQIEHLGRSFAASNTDNYNMVLPNDIVYTKSPTGNFPLGIVKQSSIKVPVIVSPLYGIFTPETPHLGYILDAYFESPVNTKNYLAPIIQKGAKNTINITNSTFLSNKLFLPTSKLEQQRIATFLSSIDRKIEAVSQQIEKTQNFKKGLLQQMFI